VLSQMCEDDVCTAAVRMHPQEARRLLARQPAVEEVFGP